LGCGHTALTDLAFPFQLSAFNCSSMTEPQQRRARVWLRIIGRVQGVGFRFSAVDEARRLGLTGWVRNTRNGDVEVVAEGQEPQLQRFINWCHSGPPGALVREVEENWLPRTGEFDSFGIRYP
jgi:acylphosphatase